MATETYELRIEGNVQGQRLMSVLHFQGVGMTADETWDSGTNLLTLWDSVFTTLWAAFNSASYWFDRVTARRVSATPSTEPFILYDLGSTTGSIADAPQADELRPSVFLVPSMGVKSGGRVFLPPPPNSQIASNVYDAGYIAAVLAFFASTTAGHTLSGITWHQVVWSRKLQSAALVTAYNLSPVFGFQKRSKKFV